jgi:menaquinone-dependent protoporphyrinogen IX oxidase
MKTIVVYRSKSGFVKKYAEWIAAELSADLLEASRVTIHQLMAYDTVIYGGGLYAVGINGVKLITQNLDKLNGKKVIVFASGATPPREEALTEVRNKNFSPEELKRIRFFYFRGGFDYHKLKPVDKMLMNLLKWILKRKKNLTADERGMLEVYDHPADFTQKKNIDELIQYVRS